eukprot:scaffold14778_cov61-Phaeocystis_antarctica.AAC.2
MPRFPKKAKGSAPPASAPVGPDAILEAVEDALERVEKKLRDREPAKAQKALSGGALPGAGCALEQPPARIC